MQRLNHIISPHDLIVITGASGFIGPRLIAALLTLGFRNLRCVVRHSSDLRRLEEVIIIKDNNTIVEVVRGNLLSKPDCDAVVRDAAVIYHLAAGTGTKSFADAYANSVVATRNVLDAAVSHRDLRRFVNVSSLGVYSNENSGKRGILDEASSVEARPELTGDAYCFAKVKQDNLVAEYGKKHNIPFVLVRPGVVYGPGKHRINGRVGIDTFGIFLHLGGSNPVPLTFVDNCAEAIALAGLVKGIEGEVFNIIDDDLPSSREFLRLFKRHVRRFNSIYVPHALSYLLCLGWEKYSSWSGGQLPPVYNRRQWKSSWKKTRYSNSKAKSRLGWVPKISTADGLERYFESCRANGSHP